MAKIPKEVVQEAVAYYQADESASLSETGLVYGISPVTISRAMAEQGLKNLRKYKTEEEYKILQKLRVLGITTCKDLENAINT